MQDTQTHPCNIQGTCASGGRFWVAGGALMHFVHVWGMRQRGASCKRPKCFPYTVVVYVPYVQRDRSCVSKELLQNSQRAFLTYIKLGRYAQCAHIQARLSEGAFSSTAQHFS